VLTMESPVTASAADGVGLGMAFTGYVNQRPPQCKASETRRTQTKLYLGRFFSPNQSTDKSVRRTFGLRQPNRKQEDAVSTKSPKSH
jgi:hypothetical protein